jgi:predicted transcriptional regulator
MSVQNLEETRWQETLQALESVRQGKVVDGDTVHEWMKSWGTDNELDPPSVSNDI